MKLDKTFAYAGPNRRSDHTVIEREIRLEPGERERFESTDVGAWWAQLGRVDPALVSPEPPDVEQAGNPLTSRDRLARICCEAAIGLQRSAGHRVSRAGLISTETPDRCRFWFEYEEPETGLDAAEIVHDAVALLLDPTADMESAEAARASLRRRIQQFRATARERAMPVDSQAIHDAALARDIPVMRMDRPPYDPITGDFRLRYNGLLRLGHGRHQHTVDGTFCVSRSEDVFGLVRDRVDLFRRLLALKTPLPGDSAPVWCQSPLRAGRAAERTGYPVALRSSHRHVEHPIGPLADRDSVQQAATLVLKTSAQVLVQPWVPGATFKVVIAAGSCIAVLEQTGTDEPEGWREVPDAHSSILHTATGIAEALGVGLMALTVVAPRIDISLQESGGAVVDAELAPELHRLFGPEAPALHRAAAAFIDWIYPEPETARIPIVAITGTNGKTTTSRMIHRILSEAGLAAGLACSDGSMVGEETISEHEDGYLYGHRVVIDNPDVEAAVLEATRGSAGSTGLGFDRCDVAVCLNVTADHLSDFVDIGTVEALAALKCTILERAGQAAVLNADDPHCCAMIPALEGRVIGLISLTRTRDQLRRWAGSSRVTCVIEKRDGRPWIVIDQDGNPIPVIAVEDIPLTFHGAAEHNVANAMHGALAAHLMGIDAATIARGLSALPATFEAAPGRLSFYRGLPFDVCMDYAHNPDGVRALCRFTSRLPVGGRRIVCLSCNNENSDEFIRETAAQAAGSFDHYICKNFSQLFGRPPEEGPALLREGLIAAGVSEAAITCVEDEAEAIDTALGMGQAGDLVVIVGGKRRQALWKQITDTGANRKTEPGDGRTDTHRKADR